MMKFSETGFAGLTLIETPSVVDHRGSFTRWFCTKQLAPVLNNRALAQINHSKSLQAGTVRGLHFQKTPHAEMKIIRCIRGRVVDVALDLRAGSTTFLKYFIKELTPDSNLMVAVPEGFAHGYQALEHDSEIIYFNTAFYEPSMEGAVNPKDPAANIDWPLPVCNLSPRDESTPFLNDEFKGLSL
jgi:dTDP-4-dehydrorhamnose 3,5-epimerase